jgi:hypothetical protein
MPGKFDNNADRKILGTKSKVVGNPKATRRGNKRYGRYVNASPYFSRKNSFMIKDKTKYPKNKITPYKIKNI